MLTLGIESTAHTFGIGIVEYNERKGEYIILADRRSVFSPPAGMGMKPADVAKHHREVCDKVLADALEEAGVSIDDIDFVSYSAGPGLPPCLRAGVDMVKKIGKPCLPVNHCIAHIEIAKWAT